MTGPNGQGPAPEPSAPAPIRIVITFAGQDRASMDIRPEGAITVAQVYAAAWLLGTWASETRTRELMQSSAGIAPAGGDLPSLLRAMGLGG